MSQSRLSRTRRRGLAVLVCAATGVFVGLWIAANYDLRAGSYSINFRLAVLAAIALAAVCTRVAEAICDERGLPLLLISAATPAATFAVVLIAGYRGARDLRDPFLFPILVLGGAYLATALLLAVIAQNQSARR